MIMHDLLITLSLIAGAAAWARQGGRRAGPWDVVKTWVEGRTLIALKHGRARPEPVVYLLAGLPGSGKTAYAKALENCGVVRLSVDDRMVQDYPAKERLARLDSVVDEVHRDLINLMRTGHCVVLDHGLNRRSERDGYKRLVVEHGGTWRLVHFPVARAELLRRLALRGPEAGAGVTTPETLGWISEHFEEPDGEGEEKAQWP